ncbi:MAG: hypothetical protein JO188_00430 [Hyphomicrobiales bacterium]|nr:hypothetical protein [Hyphomicrobiales bacterium]
MKRVSLALIVLAFSQQAAFAACTQQEAMGKAQQLSAQVQSLMAKDPQKAVDWAKKATAAQQENFKPGVIPDLDKVCTSYDQMLADIAKVQ